MRAVTIDRPGGPDVLAVTDRPPPPEPAEGEVRIRVAAATVNPTDVGLRTQGADDPPPPWTPGMELAGTVDAAGPEASWAPGRRVFAVVSPRRPEGGGQAELVTVPADSVAATPDAIDDVHAATIPMNGLTVLQALHRLGLAHGETLGVVGATGAVGGYAIQLGKVAGLRVIADAKPDDEQLVRELGADVVVPRSDDVGATFRIAAPDGVDGLIDGAILDAAVLGAIRDGGALATLRGWDGPAERGIRVEPVKVVESLHEAGRLAELASLAAQGRLTPRVAATMPVEHVADAHRRLEAGGVRGRLVLTF